MAAKQMKRKPRERLRAQGLFDAHKEARAKDGVRAPTREILAYPIAPPDDDIPF